MTAEIVNFKPRPEKKSLLASDYDNDTEDDFEIITCPDCMGSGMLFDPKRYCHACTGTGDVLVYEKVN